MSRVVNITEAKAQLSRLVEQAIAGKPVIIGKAGPRTLGGWKGRVWVAEDFDEPLPEDLQRAFEGRNG